MSELKGKGQELTGTAKEKLGKATGDADLEAEGKAEKLEGKGRQMVEKGQGKARGGKGESHLDLASVAIDYRAQKGDRSQFLKGGLLMFRCRHQSIRLRRCELHR